MTQLVRGTVVDEAGMPVGGARVMIVSGTAPTPEISILTQGDGGFGLALPAGTFLIAAFHKVYGRAECQIGPDADERPVCLRFGRRA